MKEVPYKRFCNNGHFIGDTCGVYSDGHNSKK